MSEEIDVAGLIAVLRIRVEEGLNGSPISALRNIAELIDEAEDELRTDIRAGDTVTHNRMTFTVLHVACGHAMVLHEGGSAVSAINTHKLTRCRV